MTRSSLVPFGVVLSALALPHIGSTQVPPGYFVVGAGQTNPPFTQWTGPAGVFIGHPRNPGPMRAVTGLPATLTAPRANTGNGWWGVGALTIHEPSGDLLIGDIPYGTSPNPVQLYRIHIDTQTLAATVVATFPLGTGTTGDVNQIAQIDENRVVLTCNNVSGAVGPGPMAIAELDLRTGAITQWPVSAMFTGAYEAQAICIDRSAGFAYVGGAPNGSTISTIYRIPLANPPTTRTWIASLPVFLDNLQWDTDTGTILAGGRSQSPSNGALFRVDPASGVVTTLLPNWQNAPSIALEPATGDVLFGGVQVPGSSRQGIHHFVPGGAGPTFLTNTFGSPATIAGNPMGLAVAPDPRYYGTATAMQPAMALIPWSHGRLPGGLPLAGNLGFALKLDVPPTASLLTGFVFASLGDTTAGMPQLPGTPLSLHVDLLPPRFITSVVVTGPTFPLGIPNNAALVDVTVYFQALTIASASGSGVFGASDGAQVTIL